MYLFAKDIMNLLDVGRSSAYRIIKSLNNELEEEGYYTLPGRVPTSYFKESFNIYGKDLNNSVSLQRQKN